MAIIDNISGFVTLMAFWVMRILGMFLGYGIYFLIVLHAYAYFAVVIYLLPERLGVPFSMVWVAIGLVLLFNTVFNHFFAMILHPGSPSDLIRIEKQRLEDKNRAHRQDVKVNLNEHADVDKEIERIE